MCSFPGQSIELVDFSSDTLRDAKMWELGSRGWWQTEESAARGVRVFSPEELKEAIQLAAAQAVDSEPSVNVD